MVSPSNLRSLPRNATKFDPDWAPRSAITVGIALTLLLIGFALSKLFDRCYKRAKLRDDGSDVSDHTRHLLHLQKCTRRGLLRRNRRPTMSEADRHKWQLTVLSMWQHRPADLDDCCQDEHSLMLNRLRNAWLGRRKCAAATHEHGSAEACGSTRWTPEELQAAVSQVALAWLATARAAAVRERGLRRAASGHREMMRRLSQAWRLQGEAGLRMVPIEEAADDRGNDDSESYVTVAMADVPGDLDNEFDMEWALETTEGGMSVGGAEAESDGESSTCGSSAQGAREESGGGGSYCQML